MKKIKTSFSLTPRTKSLIDILAKRLELSKSAIITLAIQDFSKRLEDYKNIFGESADRVADEATAIIQDKTNLTIDETVDAFYAIIIELEKRIDKK